MAEPNLTLEVTRSSQENVAKISEIKSKISTEIQNVEKNMTEITNLKNASIEKIEHKKKNLRELINNVDLYKKKSETVKELETTGKDIEDRQISITKLDETIINLDKQIAQIQADHDKAVNTLNLKQKKLKDQLKYYDELNLRLSTLLKMLENELLKKRSELLKRTDLSETTLNILLKELDDEIDSLNAERTVIINSINKKLSDEVSEIGEEVEYFQNKLNAILYPGKMSKAQRLALLKKGFLVTPSERIITRNDRVMTLEEAILLGLLDEESDVEEEEQVQEWEFIKIPEIEEPKSIHYAPSTVSSSEKSSSIESSLASADMDYLKRVFGKSLSLALAEICTLQPIDPIHYLAHWFLKYRFNQEIDEIKRLEIQALMIERERLEAERWHTELKEEARLAILEALFRAENMILQKDLERLALFQMEEEGEYEGPPDFNFKSVF